MAKKKSKSGIRYTDKEKAEIVQFVRDHDSENKRGGQSAAVKKFGVSALTISNWLKKAGKEPTRKATVKAPATRKRAAASSSSSSRPSSTSAVLQRMATIQERLETLQAEFDALKKQL